MSGIFIKSKINLFTIYDVIFYTIAVIQLYFGLVSTLYTTYDGMAHRNIFKNETKYQSQKISTASCSLSLICTEANIYSQYHIQYQTWRKPRKKHTTRSKYLCIDFCNPEWCWLLHIFNQFWFCAANSIKILYKCIPEWEPMVFLCWISFFLTHNFDDLILMRNSVIERERSKTPLCQSYWQLNFKWIYK